MKASFVKALESEVKRYFSFWNTLEEFETKFKSFVLCSMFFEININSGKWRSKAIENITVLIKAKNLNR